MNIKIYSTPTCPWCLLAKKYFTEKNIPFVDIDVSQDQEKAEEMVDISGQTGVPVITIEKDQNDKEPLVITGFNRDEIERAMSQKK